MPLEPSFTYISSLNPSWPGPSDAKSDGDDHIRGVKTVLTASFPLFTGPMPIAHDQVASKDYVNQTAFSAALPGQPGGTTNYALISNGGTSSWKVADIYSDTTRLAQAQAIALCF